MHPIHSLLALALIGAASICLGQTVHFDGIVTEAHGPVTLYKEASSGAPHVAQLKQGNVVRATCEDTTWCKCFGGPMSHGYVKRQHLEPLEDLDDVRLGHWLDSVITRQLVLDSMRNVAYTAGRTIDAERMREADADNDLAYEAALFLSDEYICRTGDPSMLSVLMRSIAQRPGDASEIPGDELFMIIGCREREFSAVLRTLSPAAQEGTRARVRMHLELDAVFHPDDDERRMRIRRAIEQARHP